MKSARYFTDAEFRKCVPSCSIEDMEEEFLFVLDNVRHDAGIPLVLNCAYRSREYDISKGRSGNSAHTHGMAVDIRCNTTANRYKIVKAALANGINRIGIGKAFVHLDIGDKVGLPKNVMFDYYE